MGFRGPLQFELRLKGILNFHTFLNTSRSYLHCSWLLAITNLEVALHVAYIVEVRRTGLPMMPIVPWHGAPAVGGPRHQHLDFFALEK